MGDAVKKATARSSAFGVLALVLVARFCGAAEAQTQPVLLLPPLPPPVPMTPAGQQLGNAFNAINRASLIDPSAALRANFLYASALARLRSGDTIGASADAARAQAIAGAAGIATTVPVLPPLPALSAQRTVPGAPLTAPVPLTAGALPDYILSARSRIWQARDRGADTRAATKHLRDAIDAYLEGNAARARQEARSATDALPQKR